MNRIEYEQGIEWAQRRYSLDLSPDDEKVADRYMPKDEGRMITKDEDTSERIAQEVERTEGTPAGWYQNVERTPEEGHTKRCLARALICAIENARDYELMTDIGFRIAAQGDSFLQDALSYYDGLIDCICKEG